LEPIEVAMVLAYIQVLLGEIGRALLSFYNHYSLIINGIVILYAVFILKAHQNLRSVIHSMEALMVEVGGDVGKPDLERVYAHFLERWQQERGDQKYLFPSRRDFWLISVQGKELVNLLNITPDYLKMALHKNLGKPQRSEFSPFVYRVWEDYRHSLLIGLRSRLRDPEELKAEYKKNTMKEPNRKQAQRKNNHVK